MTIELPRHIEDSIIEKVHSGLFSSMDAAMTKAALLLLEQIEREQATPPPTAGEMKDANPHKPIWDVFEEITATVPDEEWAKLPTDGAEQHDHYIYGTPKRPTP